MGLFLIFYLINHDNVVPVFAAIIVGTEEEDEIKGTSKKDSLFGLEERDKLWGRSASDYINDGEGEEGQPAVTDELATEGNVTEGEEGQPAVTDELATEGNVTEAELQNNEEKLENEGKTITVEEISIQSEESQIEEATEGNVTIKGLLIVNNTSEDSHLTTSSELLNEDEQEEKIPSLEQTTKNEDKMKVTEVCNDEMDNDLDGIIDEKKDCIDK